MYIYLATKAPPATICRRLRRYEKSQLQWKRQHIYLGCLTRLLLIALSPTILLVLCSFLAQVADFGDILFGEMLVEGWRCWKRCREDARLRLFRHNCRVLWTLLADHLSRCEGLMSKVEFG